MNSFRPTAAAALVIASLVALVIERAIALGVFVDPADPVLHGDALDPATGWPAEMAPGAPWVHAGSDGVLGTIDDVFESAVRGDVDLVIRAGRHLRADELPPPARARGPLPRATAEPFARGVPVTFQVYPTDGRRAAPPPYFEGLPFLALAFADLDGDGYVGITHLDGDASDATIELAELTPIGRRYALGRRGVAAGELFVAAGGPPAAPLAVALAAAGYAGPFDETVSSCAGCHGWAGSLAQAVLPITVPDSDVEPIPEGPAVSTRLPFVPRTDPDGILAPGPLEPELAHPDGRVRAHLEPAWIPDPGDGRFAEAFTIPLDGSDPSTDVAEVLSGTAARAGLSQRPDPQHYRALPGRPIRPGVGPNGLRRPLEILQRLRVPDDGPDASVSVSVVPLDLLGNVATLEKPLAVSLSAGPGVRIITPDTDGDAGHEVVVLAGAAGAEIVVDDSGLAFDGPDDSWILLEANGRLARIGVLLADPDVDQSGTVDETDEALVRASEGTRLDQTGYAPRLDLDGNGVIESIDVALAATYRGASAAPDAGPGPGGPQPPPVAPPSPTDEDEDDDEDDEDESDD